MKPVWDKLIAEFKDSKSALVADVDCTAGGKSLCDEVGVRGYPTIKYGDPDDLKDYKGGRDFAALKKFAEENLGPRCGPGNMDLCDAEKKAQIEKFQQMPAAELEAAIEEKTKKIGEFEADFKTFVEGLQKQYSDTSEKKDKDIEEIIKTSGLGLMKSVAAHNQERVDAKNSFDGYIHSLRSAIEGSGEEKGIDMDETEKEKIMNALKDGQSWLDSNTEADSEKIRDKHKEVADLCAPIMSKYSQEL